MQSRRSRSTCDLSGLLLGGARGGGRGHGTVRRDQGSLHPLFPTVFLSGVLSRSPSLAAGTRRDAVNRRRRRRRFNESRIKIIQRL